MLAAFLFFVSALQSGSIFDMQKFETKGLSKADGLDIFLNYPEGWQLRPGRHPHVVEDFVDTADELNCNLVVQNLGEEPAPSDRTALLQEAVELADAAVGLKLIEQQPTKIDTLPALSSLSGGNLSNGGMSINAVQLSLATIYRQDLIALTCTKGIKSSDNSDDISVAVNLFKRIGNSIVIANQWR